MKETSDRLSKLAARVLASGKATPREIKQLAGSVLSQDVTKGERGSAKPDIKKRYNAFLKRTFFPHLTNREKIIEFGRKAYLSGFRAGRRL